MEREGKKWEFQCEKEGKIIKLFNIESIPILLYIMIKDANPYLKENQEYIKNRLIKEWGKSLSPLALKLAKSQKMICPVCKTSLRKSENEELEIHHRKAKSKEGTNKINNLLLLHKTCHTSVTNCNDPNLIAKYTTEGIIIP